MMVEPAKLELDVEQEDNNGVIVVRTMTHRGSVMDRN